MLSFDEPRLNERLARLSPSKQLAFTASCCQRVAPVYLEWAASESPGTASFVQDVLELLWKECVRATREIRAQLSAIDLGSLVEHTQQQYSIPLGGYASDALTVFHFALEFQRSVTTIKAAECGRWALNVVDALAMARESENLITASVAERINANRSVQRELRKQSDDLDLLARSRRVDAETVARLRGESARLGQRLLNEIRFTLETG